jgi:hypothetical protein
MQAGAAPPVAMAAAAPFELTDAILRGGGGGDCIRKRIVQMVYVAAALTYAPPAASLETLLA